MEKSGEMKSSVSSKFLSDPHLYAILFAFELRRERERKKERPSLINLRSPWSSPLSVRSCFLVIQDSSWWSGKKWRWKMTETEMQFCEIRLGYFRARKKMCEKESVRNCVIFSGWHHDGNVFVYVCVLWHLSHEISILPLSSFPSIFSHFSLFLSCLFFSHLPPLSLSPFRLKLLTDTRRVSKKRKIMKCNSMKRMVRRASDIRVVCVSFFFQE